MIGIVGGMGPYAGIDLHTAILNNSGATKDQDHLKILHVNAASEIPDRTGFLLGNNVENPSAAIIRQIELLINAGADTIGIPCNTAHAPEIFDPIVQYFSRLGPGYVLVNMLEEILSHLDGRKVGRAGLVATLGTYRSDLYRKYGSGYGVDIVYPEDRLQRLSHDCIYNETGGIKKLGYLSDPCAAQYDVIFGSYRSRNIDTIILGCTEISMVFPEKYKGMRMIRSTDILAKALIREARRGNGI